MRMRLRHRGPSSTDHEQALLGVAAQSGHGSPPSQAITHAPGAKGTPLRESERHYEPTIAISQAVAISVMCFSFSIEKISEWGSNRISGWAIQSSKSSARDCRALVAALRTDSVKVLLKRMSARPQFGACTIIEVVLSHLDIGMPSGIATILIANEHSKCKSSSSGFQELLPSSTIVWPRAIDSSSDHLGASRVVSAWNSKLQECVFGTCDLASSWRNH
jgi:hypothetical protein